MIREFFSLRFTMPVYMSLHQPLPFIDAAVGGK
jgi:hypothetical protein